MMKKTTSYLLAIFCLVVLVAGGLALRHQRQQALAEAATPATTPWAVRTATVTRGRATQGFPALALVKGDNEAAIAPRLGGIVLDMGPREGETVAAGELLARIDTRELEDRLASLEAEREGAVADAERKARDTQRGEELLKGNSISESLVDQQRADARTARERVRSLDNQIAAERTRLGYARIVAPFTGVISDRLADPGDLAAVGKPIYRLVANGSGRLEVRLPAEVLAQVRPGTEVELSQDDQTLVLRTDRVFPDLDERSMGRLEIEVPELPFGAAPGALLRARIVTEGIDEALLVPADTLLPGVGPDHARVLRLNDEQPPRIQTVSVNVRLRAAEGVAVSGELQPGDRLVTAHETTLLRLRDGDSVRIEGAAQ